MAIQYHFLVSCKRVTETEWLMEMQAENEEVPLSVTQPNSTRDGVLTTEPILQAIADSSVMTHYLRQLNRRNSRRLLGHNDSVIWNISQRFSRLRIGQWITIKVSYFELKRLKSGTYEINSLGIFPLPKPPVVPIEQIQKHQLPQVAIDMIANLVNHVETVQRELGTTQKTLHDHEIRLKTMEDRIRGLKTENRQLREVRDAGAKASQALPVWPQKSRSSQPSPSSDAVDDGRVADKARSMFQQFVKAPTSSASLREPSANYPRRGDRKRR